jgi:hypothetical protein
VEVPSNIKHIGLSVEGHIAIFCHTLIIIGYQLCHLSYAGFYASRAAGDECDLRRWLATPYATDQMLPFLSERALPMFAMPLTVHFSCMIPRLEHALLHRLVHC